MIFRYGRDRDLFDRAAPNIYGQQLSDEQRTQVFTAYSTAHSEYGDAKHWASESSGAVRTSSARGRSRPPKAKPQHQFGVADLHAGDGQVRAGDPRYVPIRRALSARDEPISMPTYDEA